MTAARIGLDVRVQGRPLLAEAIDQAGAVVRVTGERREISGNGIEDLRRAGQPSPGHLDGEQAVAGSLARMHPLDLRAALQEREQPAGVAGGDAEGARGLLGAEPAQHRARGGRAEDPGQRSVVEAPSPRRRMPRRRDPRGHLHADHDRAQDMVAVRSRGLPRGQRGRHDGCAGMRRSRGVAVVEFEPVRGCAVDQGGASRAQPSAADDHRVVARVVLTGEVENSLGGRGLGADDRGTQVVEEQPPSLVLDISWQGVFLGADPRGKCRGQAGPSWR